MTGTITQFLLSMGDSLLHQNMMKRLRFLDEAQWWPREKIQALRDDRLRLLVRTAYQEVPFYRSLFDSRGVSWQDIRTAADLTKLPIVTREMLRRHFPQQTTRPTGWKTYEARSSGSTGANVRVIEDLETAGYYRASFLLALRWTGWEIGEPHVQTGMSGRTLQKRFKDWLLRCHYVSAADLSEPHLDRVLDLLERRSIGHLWGYPGSLYYLARRAAARGWTRRLRSVVTWGDKLYEHYRTTIEHVFRSPVHDTYGCGEGIQVAAQCGFGSHYHIHSTEVILECVDGQGMSVAPEEAGNLVLTRLHPGPTPLIRYSVGDVGVRGTTQECACGRQWEILESIEGRISDVVVTPKGNRLIVHFFTGILEHFTGIDSYQVVQKDRYNLEVRIVPAAGADPGDLGHSVKAALEQRGLRDMEIRVRAVEEIPVPPSGKRRFVISEVPARLEGSGSRVTGVTGRK